MAKDLPLAKQANRRPAVDADLFKASMADLPSAVTIVTCWGPNEMPMGATLSSVGSLSLDPPLMFAAFDRRSQTLRALSERRAPFMIHVLAEGQEELARRFSSRDVDRFAGVDWLRLPEGPQIDACCCVIACRVHALLPCGDHMIVAGEARRVSRDGSRQPLLYHRRAIYPVPSRPKSLRKEIQQ